jgi:hypothetical protein
MQKRPKAPRVITFEGLDDMASKWSWRLIGYRCPNKGEFFMSGAIPQAYKARQHMTREYFVVEPITQHRRMSRWMPIDTPPEEY